MVTNRDAVTAAFPAVADIGDEALAKQVVETWTRALAETAWDLDEIPWFPPVQDELGLPDERLVDHVNDVVAAADALAATLADRRGARVDRDVVLAGALVHDVSKLYEFSPAGPTPVFDLLGHPYYGVFATASAGLPVEVVHVVLSHTHRTNVEPVTLEAAVVRRADEVAAAAIRAQATTEPGRPK
ncbi:HD domain-containing protein [Halobacteriaceae archaeon GCM10025711]